MINFNRSLKLNALILLACLVSACDGGLFGTGTGDDPMIILPDSSTAGDSMSPGAPPDMTNEVDLNTVTFNNLQTGTSQTTPLINIINLSDRSVNALSNETTLFSTPIAINTASQVSELQLGENTIAINDGESPELNYGNYSINAGESSLTTIIVRGSSEQIIDGRILRTLARTSDTSTAQVRLVLADALDTNDSPAQFSLLPNGIEPGSGEINFPNLSLSSDITDAYQTAGAGEYELVDSLNRFNPVQLNLAAGKIYTLIILNNEVNSIFTHEDDLLAD